VLQGAARGDRVARGSGYRGGAAAACQCVEHWKQKNYIKAYFPLFFKEI